MWLEARVSEADHSFFERLVSEAWFAAIIERCQHISSIMLGM